MKKIDRFMNEMDRKIDRNMKPMLKFFQKNFVIFSTTVLSLLFLLFIFKTFYNRPYYSSVIIKTHLKKINNALNKIDKDCSILSIPGNRVVIDFLTVKKFVGSVVGGINLAYPQKWEGPYEKVNPAIQQNFYQLVKTKEGYFIIPGKGTKLPNGMTLGKDFEINPSTHVSEMTKPGGGLFYKGIVLARKVSFEIGDWDSSTNSEKKTEEINELLEEFNEAMSFTHNESPHKTL